MDKTELASLERLVDREVKARFPAGSVRRVTLLQQGDGPDDLVVRVFADTGTGNGPRSLDRWAQACQAQMKRMRRELSLRLPEAKLLEFTVDGTGEPGSAPVISLPHDPAVETQTLPPRELVATALSLLRVDYVFPDLAERAATAIEARLATGEYDGLAEQALADRLTSQLQEICDDKHLRVRTTPRRDTEPQAAAPPREPRQRPPHNFGICRAERLDGNVGYLDVRAVAHPAEAGPVIAAAMELISGTYALIIDLRRNRGGSPEGVVFWCSYLFPGAGVHLNDIFHADTGETRQFWSLAWVPGTRYLDKPVYVLSSAETFSGGEDFCYTLQAQGRAEIIGETTGGGAHPTRMVPISATMAIGIPFARSVNPVTGTNWQGTGVVPDTLVPAGRAYDVAYGKALQHVLEQEVPPPVADEARAALGALSGQADEQPSRQPGAGTS